MKLTPSIASVVVVGLSVVVVIVVMLSGVVGLMVGLSVVVVVLVCDWPSIFWFFCVVVSFSPLVVVASGGGASVVGILVVWTLSCFLWLSELIGTESISMFGIVVVIVVSMVVLSIARSEVCTISLGLSKRSKIQVI